MTRKQIYNQEFKKKQKELLTDCYIKKLLSKNKVELTQENISNKRSQIQKKKDLEIKGLKICAKCKKTQDIKNFRKQNFKQNNKSKIWTVCKSCVNEYIKDYNKRKPELKYNSNKRYMLKYPEKAKESRSKQAKNAVIELQDCYIKRTIQILIAKETLNLVKIKTSDIPQDLIDLKRKQILTGRLLKSLNNSNGNKNLQNL